MGLNQPTNMDTINEDFGGVYYFTNPTTVPRTFLWNNKEYTFEPESRSPLIIISEPLENIQEIRKRFAYRMAIDRVYEGEVTPSGFDYLKAKEMGNGTPPTFDDKILEPFIEECLKPLPIKKASIQVSKKGDSDDNYRATKALGEGEDPAFIFSEENRNVQKFGAMSDR